MSIFACSTTGVEDTHKVLTAIPLKLGRTTLVKILAVRYLQKKFPFLYSLQFLVVLNTVLSVVILFYFVIKLLTVPSNVIMHSFMINRCLTVLTENDIYNFLVFLFKVQIIIKVH